MKVQKKKEHVQRIEKKMKDLGFDEVEVDPMGNILGYMGTGKTLLPSTPVSILVGIGNRDNWNFDPYEGFEDETKIGGRGVSDH